MGKDSEKESVPNAVSLRHQAQMLWMKMVLPVSSCGKSQVQRVAGAVWAMVTLAFILALPLLYSTVAFSAVISISTVGLYISCEHSYDNSC